VTLPGNVIQRQRSAVFSSATIEPTVTAISKSAKAERMKIRARFIAPFLANSFIGPRGLIKGKLEFPDKSQKDPAGQRNWRWSGPAADRPFDKLRVPSGVEGEVRPPRQGACRCGGLGAAVQPAQSGPRSFRVCNVIRYKRRELLVPDPSSTRTSRSAGHPKLKT